MPTFTVRISGSTSLDGQPAINERFRDLIFEFKVAVARQGQAALHVGSPGKQSKKLLPNGNIDLSIVSVDLAGCYCASQLLRA